MTVGGSTIMVINEKGMIHQIVHDDLFKLNKGESIKKYTGLMSISDEILNAVEDMDQNCQKIIGEHKKYVFSGLKHKKDYQITLVELSDDVLSLDKKLMSELENTKRELEDVKMTLYDNLETLGTYAIKDMLTGAYNRGYLNTKFQEIQVTQQRRDIDVAFVYVDLNQFKLVNTSFGFEEGDRLLKKFTEISMHQTRQDFDFIFRIGPDDFIILMVECNYDDAMEVCERLNDAYKMHTVISSISYGIVMMDEEEISLDECLEFSEKKMSLFKQKFLKHEHLGDAN
ncbi:MAG: GGDEF domain-containing protein [Clostridia bacterium]|nr:GGDEF domain-containing protein [Clostridia bacterium]